MLALEAAPEPFDGADDDADVLDVGGLDVVPLVAELEPDEHAATRKPVETRIKASVRRMLPS
jgi:hypothetical protein